MEQLTKIRQGLIKQGKPVFDFGTGDPKIPTWPKIIDALKNAVPEISQYPSVRGSEELRKAQLNYLERRFGLRWTSDLEVMPSGGSKEAIFHIALSLVGRSGGKKHIIYPDPGYPVYKSSTIFAGGIPYPVLLEAKSDYLLEPWSLPLSVQNDAAGIWVNYPHNPTGNIAPASYWKQLVEWAHKFDCVILSDDCYVDVYDSSLDEPGANKDLIPMCPLTLSSDRVLTFMSLSKRSGMTGYRSGFIAGDKRILQPHLEARANFGVGVSNFVQAASTVAWLDDEHVAARRKIFTKRIAMAVPLLQKLGLIDEAPKAAFYLWCKVPSRFGDEDIDFCLKLAEHGVITSPSRWLSENVRGYFRFALVPNEQDTAHALGIVEKFLQGK
jgi:succinyldiaminopimelate transaminase